MIALLAMPGKSMRSKQSKHIGPRYACFACYARKVDAQQAKQVDCIAQ